MMKNRMILLAVLVCAVFLSACEVRETVGTEPHLSADYTSAPSSAPTQESTQVETTEHIHSFADANCVQPKICTQCGATEGTALGHQWNEADCTGPKTCVLCGETDGAALGHDWIEATCDTPQTCARCGVTSGKAKGHTWNGATCTSAKTCSACGITEGTPMAHNWRNATYTSPKKCTKCGATEGSLLEKPGGANYHGHVYTGGQYSKKFHYEANCAGKNSHEITWDEVERRGLKPCGTCVLK